MPVVPDSQSRALAPSISTESNQIRRVRQRSKLRNSSSTIELIAMKVTTLGLLLFRDSEEDFNYATTKLGRRFRGIQTQKYSDFIAGERLQASQKHLWKLSLEEPNVTLSPESLEPGAKKATAAIWKNRRFKRFVWVSISYPIHPGDAQAETIRRTGPSRRPRDAALVARPDGTVTALIRGRLVVRTTATLQFQDRVFRRQGRELANQRACETSPEKSPKEPHLR